MSRATIEALLARARSRLDRVTVDAVAGAVRDGAVLVDIRWRPRCRSWASGARPTSSAASRPGPPRACPWSPPSNADPHPRARQVKGFPPWFHGCAAGTVNASLQPAGKDVLVFTALRRTLALFAVPA